MSEPHVVSAPGPFIELKLTLQEAQAVLRVVGTASQVNIIEKEHLRPIDWVMDRLVRLVHEAQKASKR